MKKEENIIQVTITKPKLHCHEVKLKIGNWKKHFDLNYVNTIIAMALNYCSKNNAVFINGYLITSQNLYLAIQTNEKHIDTTVNKIEAQIIILLKNNRQKLKENRGEVSFITDDENLFYAARKPLFKILPLENDHLVKLLTGKKVTLPYFDRDLESLKVMIHNHAFCSAINYLGGVGPVEVTPLRD
ncbi:hypothetical protein ACWA1F_21190 [Flavobacterium sp. 3-218]